MPLDDRAFVAGQEDVAVVADSLHDVLGVSLSEAMIDEFLAERFVLNVRNYRRADKPSVPIELRVKSKKLFVFGNRHKSFAIDDQVVALDSVLGLRRLVIDKVRTEHRIFFCQLLYGSEL